MSQTLTLHDFKPLLHTEFRLVEKPGYELELFEVEDNSNQYLEQFSLVFTCLELPWLPQGMYKLRNSQLEECELFLVPLGPDQQGMRYQAAFSRIIDSDHLPKSVSANRV